MVKIVLTADHALMSDFSNLPLGSFFSCIPADNWASRAVFKIIAGKIHHKNGVAVFAPYALRKIEAGLVKKYGRKNVVLAHPDYLERFIDKNTEIVGVTVMDPFGLGPVSMSFTYGGQFTSYTKHMFLKLMNTIRGFKNYNFKLVVGGPGVWQFNYKEQYIDEFRIDHLVSGEVDHKIGEIFDNILNGTAPLKIHEKGCAPINMIPMIQGAVMEGMVETMRGCGRGCKFCEVTLRKPRYMDHDFIKKEIAVNVKAGKTDVHAHADDIFVYKLEDYKNMTPNSDAIRELFKEIMSVKGVKHSNPTHGTLAAAFYDPELVSDITRIVKGGPDHWIGIQTGLETGSTRLVNKIMPRKSKPFAPDEWREVVLSGMKVLNDNCWYPAMTAIVGLPEETPEDVWDTTTLIDQMEKVPNNHFIIAPLTFVPIGSLKGKKFFNMDDTLNEARFNFFYRCWRHITWEIETNMWSLYNANPGLKAIMSVIARTGSRYLLRKIENYGKDHGFAIKHMESEPIHIRV